MLWKSPGISTTREMMVVKISAGDGVSRWTWAMERMSGCKTKQNTGKKVFTEVNNPNKPIIYWAEGVLTMCPSLAATKQTRPPLKNVPFSEPNADSAAATDMIQPQLPSTLFLWGEKKSTSWEKYNCISIEMAENTKVFYVLRVKYEALL